MRMKRYAIRFCSNEKQSPFWVQLTGIDDDHPDGTGWTLVQKFDRFCILDEDQADGFILKPGTDSRYEKRVVTLTISKQ